MLLNEWWYENMYKWCHESRRNYTFVKLKATKISKRCVLFWSRGPDGYRKNDRKRAVVWPWLVLELSTVLALTQLGIRQSDWRRVGIRSTNLHIVVECKSMHEFVCIIKIPSWTVAHASAMMGVKSLYFLYARPYIHIQTFSAVDMISIRYKWINSIP